MSRCALPSTRDGDGPPRGCLQTTLHEEARSGHRLLGHDRLVLSVLRAFGCVDSILRGAAQIAARSPHALPQTSLLGSVAVGAVSGSGAANAITTGSATIPAMRGAGMPRVTAAAIETA